MNDLHISVTNLKKHYGNHTVLNGLTFDVQRGSIFALLGENGAGKTTTVRILSTLIRPDGGTVKIADCDLMKNGDEIRQKISVTGQYAAVDDLLTGEENLLMMARLNHLSRRASKQRTAELLRQFDLLDAAARPVKTYSGGMRRRLDIAISLIASPEIIFLDEPTTGLDPRSRMNMWTVIHSLAESGVTIFLTTQYLEEADRLADKIALIHNGKMTAEGTAEELKRIIGEEKIICYFSDQKSLSAAGYALNGQTDESAMSLAVQTGGSVKSLRELLNQLHEMGIEPVDVQFRKPSLDDVFIEMTNNPVKEGAAE